MEKFKPIVKKHLAELYTIFENKFDEILLKYNPTDLVVSDEVGSFISDFTEPMETIQIVQGGLYQFGLYNERLRLHIDPNMKWRDRKFLFFNNLVEYALEYPEDIKKTLSAYNDYSFELEFNGDLI